MGIGERENGSLLVASFFRLFLEGWKTFFCFSHVEMPNHFFSFPFFSLVHYEKNQ
jgi:hypothetical protein